MPRLPEIIMITQNSKLKTQKHLPAQAGNSKFKNNSFAVKKIFITNRFGEKSELLVRKPDKKGKFPIVILVQGFGMDMHEYKNAHDEIAEELVKANFVTVQFDFSYQKHITDTEDEEIPLSKRTHEAEDVVMAVIKNKNIDQTKIGLLGMSFGVSTILKMDMSNIKSLCLVSGLGFRPAKFIKRYTDKGAIINRNGVTKLPRTSGKITKIAPDFWSDFDNLVHEKLVTNLTKPTMVIYGDKDTYIFYDDVMSVYQAMPQGHKYLKLFKHGDHGIVDVPREMRQEFLRTVVKWFKVTLTKEGK